MVEKKNDIYELNSEEEKILKRAWKYHKFADNLLSNRVNFFLVAESMLLVSYVTTFSITKNLQSIRFIIAISGLLITSYWYYVNTRLAIKLKYLKTKHLKNDPIYKEYSVIVMKNVPHDKSAGRILCILLPNTIITLWLMLLLYTFYPYTNIFIVSIIYVISFFIIYKIFDLLLNFKNLEKDLS